MREIILHTYAGQIFCRDCLQLPFKSPLPCNGSQKAPYRTTTKESRLLPLARYPNTLHMPRFRC